MYKLILIDADRTIFDFDRAEIHSVTEAFKAYQVTDKLDEIVARYKVINTKLWKEYEQGTMDKKKIPTERFRLLFAEHDIDLDPVEFGKEYLKNLTNNDFIIDGALDLCKYLHSKYKLVILTNGIKYVQEGRLAKSGLKDYIHDMVVSDELGIPKPNPEIYDYTLDKVGKYPKDEIIMIGDSLSSDIQGGINYSIDTCWYNSDETPSIEGVNPTYTVTTLEEIFEIL